MAFDIQEELKKLPGKPGVYLMHDADDTIIYVGKAISLKNRVRQYSRRAATKGRRLSGWSRHIARFEVYCDGFRTGGARAGVQPYQRAPSEIQYDAER